MKKITVIAIAALLFGMNANAQVRRNVNSDQKVQSDSLKRNHDRGKIKDMNLTPEQKSKMKELRQNNKSQMDAIKNDATLTQDQKKEKIQTLRKSEKQNMGQVLTEEQKSKLREAHEKGKNADFIYKEKRMKDLGLNADQKMKMKEMRTDSKQQMEAIKNDPSLTQDQRKQKTKELHQNQQKEMNNLLTADQKAKMKSERRLKSPNKKTSTIPE